MMSSTGVYWRLWAAGFLPLLCGCVDPSGDASGVAGYSEVDSAGIRVVRNGLEPASTPWEFREILRVSPETAGQAAEFINVSDAARLSDGRLVVIDAAVPMAALFGSDGGLQEVFATEGEGPGELQGPFKVVALSNDSIVIVDGLKGAVSVFSPDGSFVRQFSIGAADAVPRQWKLDPGGQIVVRRLSNGVVDRVLRISDEGDSLPLSPIPLVYPRPSSDDPQGLLLRPAPVWGALENSVTATGHSHAYRLVLHDSLGEVLRVITKASSDNRVSDREKEDFLGRMKSLMDQRVGPGYWEEFQSGIRGPEDSPLITDVLAGPESSIWIQRASPLAEIPVTAVNRFRAGGYGSSVWDVFTESGRFLFSQELPAGFRLLKIQAQHLIGIQTTELGIEEVVVLELVGAG